MKHSVSFNLGINTQSCKYAKVLINIGNEEISPLNYLLQARLRAMNY